MRNRLLTGQGTLDTLYPWWSWVDASTRESLQMIAKNHPVINCEHMAFLYVNQELTHKDGTLQFVQTLASLFLTPGLKLQ